MKINCMLHNISLCKSLKFSGINSSEGRKPQGEQVLPVGRHLSFFPWDGLIVFWAMAGPSPVFHEPGVEMSVGLDLIAAFSKSWNCLVLNGFYDSFCIFFPQSYLDLEVSE